MLHTPREKRERSERTLKIGGEIPRKRKEDSHLLFRAKCGIRFKNLPYLYFDFLVIDNQSLEALDKNRRWVNKYIPNSSKAEMGFNQLTNTLVRKPAT